MVNTESAHSTVREQRNAAAHLSTSSRTHPSAQVQTQSLRAPQSCENAIRLQTRNITPSKYARRFSSSDARLMKPSSVSTGPAATVDKMNRPKGVHAARSAFKYLNGALSA